MPAILSLEYARTSFSLLSRNLDRQRLHGGDGARSLGSVTNVIPDALDKASLIYRPEIQQGNVVTRGTG